MRCMSTDNLADKLAIRDVIEGFSDAVTHRAWEKLGAAFHEDATWKVGAPMKLTLQSRDGIVAGLSAGIGRMDFLAQMTQSMVISIDGDKATSRTVIHEIGRTTSQKSGLCLIGSYNDILSRREGIWAFDSREFIVIYLDPAWIDGTVGSAFT